MKIYIAGKKAGSTACAKPDGISLTKKGFYELVKTFSEVF